jgi:amino acid transporter
MKAINILTHTYTIIASFLIILISGENFGGFYLLYLLMALPHGGVHALLALFGIAVMIIAKNYFRERKNPLLIGTLNIFGVLLLLLSLFFFFYNDKGKYNYGTFYDLVPQITLIIFSIISVSFILVNLIGILKRPKRDNSMLHL